MKRTAHTLLLALAVAPGVARAANLFYVGSAAGDWNSAANWSATRGGAGGAGVPALGDVFLANADATPRTLTFDVPTVSLTSFNVSLSNAGGTNPGVTDTFVLNAGTINPALEYIGGYTPTFGSTFTGSGTVNQAGGLNLVSSNFFLGNRAGDTGFYNLSGTGVLNPLGTESIGYSGAGTFVQTGGTNTVGTHLAIAAIAGGTGTVTISGGQTTVGQNVYVGGSLAGAGGIGKLTVTGTGTLAVTGTLTVLFSVANAVTLSGGTLTLSALDLNGAPSLFNWTGGTLNLTTGITFDPSAAPASTNAAFGSSLALGGGQALNVTGNEALGGTGTFALTLNSGSAHTVSGTITLNVGSAFTQNGGTVSFAAFAQNGGTVGGTFTNTGAYSYQSGVFNARLINQGTLTLSADFVAANGMENDAPLTLPATRTITLNGAGLDNEGSLTLTGGRLVLNAAGANINRGTFTLYAGAPFALNDASLTNSGTLNLNGSSLTSTTGTLTNAGSGTVIGTGTILAPFVNNGLFIIVAGDTNVSAAWTNAGEIALNSIGATVDGAAINNTGTIDGAGNVGSAVTNAGVIEATLGTIRLGGTLVNSATGLITAAAGNKVFVTGALGTNAGVINLAGGTFDTNNQALANTGQISGYGTLRTGGAGLTNTGAFTLIGGNSTINGPVTNNSTINIKSNPALFTGTVTNNGTIKTTGTTVTYAGAAINNGIYVSDPSTNIFQANLTNGAGGSIMGSTGDSFILSGGTFSNTGTFINAGTLYSSDAVTNAGTFTQTGPQSWSAGTSFTNVAGNAMFTTDAGTAAARPLAVAVSGGTLTLAGTQHLQSLAITGGVVNINGDTILSTGNVATLSAALQAHLIATTSATAGTTVAIVTGSDFLALNPTGLRHGQTILPTDTLLSLAIAGDANLDGIVTLDDYLQMDAAYAHHLASAQWINGDFNHNGTIDAGDYALIDAAFRQHSTLADGEIALHAAEFGQPYLDALGALETIPEPASLLLLAMGLPMVMRRRRRR